MAVRTLRTRVVRAVATTAVGLLALVGCSDDDAAPVLERAPQETVDGSTTTTARELSIPEIVQEVQPSVVAVITESGEGSGVVWSADGVIVTNNHVVAGAGDIDIVFADGDRVDADLIATDPITDLAVVRAARGDLPPAKFSERLPHVGETAIAMGNPLGFENSVTAGIVSGLHRSIPGSAQQTQALVDLLQTDAAISPGNSGGALVGATAEVIGINVAYIPPQARAVSLGFAIPSPTVIDVVEQLLENGTVQHAFMGIVPGVLTPQIAERLGVDTEGFVVQQVVQSGPAAEAGLQPGDVVTAVDGEKVESVEEFLALLRGRRPGDEVEVTLVRDGDEITAVVTLADRPPTG